MVQDIKSQNLIPNFAHLSIDETRQVFASLAGNKLPMHWLNGWLLHVLGRPSSFLITDGDYRLTDSQSMQLTDGIKRMMAGEPLAYLTGFQGFWGREFLVNVHTLIPRADTEILVETALTMIKQAKLSHPAILDLGTGTGCIAITLALELPDAAVTAVDISPDAIAVAIKNAQLLKATNCTALLSDWYASVSGQFDLIVSNPPYINPSDRHLADLTHEPITALVADAHGFADIDKIILGAAMHLKADGILIIEHGYDQGMGVHKTFELAGFDGVQTIKDYGGNDRITLGVWRG